MDRWTLQALSEFLHLLFRIFFGDGFFEEVVLLLGNM